MAASINERLASLETLMRENQKTLYRVHEAIYGNGKPGLIAEVQLLRQSTSLHDDGHRGRQSDRKWSVSTVLSLAGVAAAILIAIFK